MVITRDGKEIELTEDEVYSAYKEYYHKMCKSDVKAYLDDRGMTASDKDVDTLASVWGKMVESLIGIDDDYMYDNRRAFDEWLDRYAGNYGVELRSADPNDVMKASLVRDGNGWTIRILDDKGELFGEANLGDFTGVFPEVLDSSADRIGYISNPIEFCRNYATDVLIAGLQDQFEYAGKQYPIEKLLSADEYRKLVSDISAQLIEPVLAFNEERSPYKIKNFYTEAFPDDDLGERINPEATFSGLWDVLAEGNDVYEYLGVGDSVVRERVFQELADREGTDYDYVHDTWASGCFPEETGEVLE